ncbi:MAG TPA: SgcJ/EcaC family oxidoreductase [Gemmatimonadales bacterium]
MSRADIATVNRMFEEAARKSDANRMASLYTQDAMALPPDGPVIKGRENIKQMWASAMKQMGLKDVKLDTLDLEIAGDVASEVGEATLSLETEAGKRQTAVMKFVVVWKKVDGQWRLHRDIWNAKGA